MMDASSRRDLQVVFKLLWRVVLWCAVGKVAAGCRGGVQCEGVSSQVLIAAPQTKHTRSTNLTRPTRSFVKWLAV